MKKNVWIFIGFCLLSVFLFATNGFSQSSAVIQGDEASTPSKDKNKQKVKAVSGKEEIDIVSSKEIKLSDLVLRFSAPDVAVEGDQLSSVSGKSKEK